MFLVLSKGAEQSSTGSQAGLAIAMIIIVVVCLAVFGRK